MTNTVLKESDMGAVLDAFAYGLIPTLIWYPAVYTAFRGALKRKLPLARFWAGFAVADLLDGFLGRLVSGSLSKEASSIAFALAIPVVVGIVVLYALYFVWPKDASAPPARTEAQTPEFKSKP